MLSIKELTKRVQEQAKPHTHEERVRLLKNARILNEDGSVNTFFTTIQPVEGRGGEAQSRLFGCTQN